ncbi:MAG: class I SAM-dependent methyltransferase [Actinomycetota bacterium]|nr:class I SAM-dependent methyltransferase [Actinomycetota bacterium]
MDSNDGIQAWDAAAGNYIDRIGWGGDSFDRRFAPFLTQQLGDANGKRVLDLGCGHGWLTGRLADSGADVVGVDGSSALISAAQLAYPQVEFVIHDLTAGLPWRNRQFDCIVSHMVLMDLPDIAPLIADVTAALPPTGRFVFTILHPSFFGRQPVQDPATGTWSRHVNGYLSHEQRQVQSFGGHTHYHRPLSWYATILSEHRLAITGLDEPRTLPAHRRPESEWSAYERWFATIPTMIAVACRRLPV